MFAPVILFGGSFGIFGLNSSSCTTRIYQHNDNNKEITTGKQLTYTPMYTHTHTYTWTIAHYDIYTYCRELMHDKMNGTVTQTAVTVYKCRPSSVAAMEYKRFRVYTHTHTHMYETFCRFLFLTHSLSFACRFAR